LDAKKVADRLGVSVARIASLTPVTRQALNETPDSSRVQEALDPIARSLAVLETALAPEHVNQWLNASHSRLNGSTPLEALLDGRAERVARMLEIARDGGVN
jgi:hypothetical protein